MVDRAARQAVTQLGESLKLAYSCLSEQPARLLSSPQFPGFWRFTFIPESQPILLKTVTGEGRFSLSLRHDVTLPGMQRPSGTLHAHIAAYRMEIRDRRGNEILAYHWHPISESDIVTPHLHLSFVVGNIDGLDLRRAHLPTGNVSVAAIVRFLIEELGVEPNRADWDRVLASIEASI